MGSRRMVETASSVLQSIGAQHCQSLQRLEQSAEETTRWLQQVFEIRRKQIAESRTKHESAEGKSPLKKKAKVETAPSSVDFVYTLKVKELSAMLRERGLDGNGVKKVLQARLVEAIEQQEQRTESESLSSQQSAKEDNNVSSGIDNPASGTAESQAAIGDPVPATGEHMDGVSEMEIEEVSDEMVVVPEKQEEELVPMETDKQSCERKSSTEERNNNPVSNMGTSPKSGGRSPLKLVKSAFRALSPAKTKNVSSLIQKIETKQTREEQTLATASSHEDGSQSNADAKTSLSSTSVSKSFRTWGPSGTVTKKGTDPPGSSSITSMKTFKEARKARIAEIRSKSKPVVPTTTSSISSVPALSKVRAYAECAQLTTSDGKKNRLAAQMREKAQALLQGHGSVPAQEPAKENSPNKVVQEYFGKSTGTSTTKMVGDPMRPFGGPSTATKVLGESTKSIKSFASSTNAMVGQTVSKATIAESKAAVMAAKPDLTPSSVKSSFSTVFSPMDTYELSDRDQSDSESEDEGQRKPKKRIPEWAQKAKLIPALDHQFSQKLHDPDQIFGEVLTCDLQEIFDIKKARYQRRTSSGNWTQDRVTAAEKLAYKRNEGFGCEEH